MAYKRTSVSSGLRPGGGILSLNRPGATGSSGPVSIIGTSAPGGPGPEGGGGGNPFEGLSGLIGPTGPVIGLEGHLPDDPSRESLTERVVRGGGLTNPFAQNIPTGYTPMPAFDVGTPGQPAPNVPDLTPSVPGGLPDVFGPMQPGTPGMPGTTPIMTPERPQPEILETLNLSRDMPEIAAPDAPGVDIQTGTPDIDMSFLSGGDEGSQFTPQGPRENRAGELNQRMAESVLAKMSADAQAQAGRSAAQMGVGPGDPGYKALMDRSQEGVMSTGSQILSGLASKNIAFEEQARRDEEQNLRFILSNPDLYSESQIAEAKRKMLGPAAGVGAGFAPEPGQFERVAESYKSMYPWMSDEEIGQMAREATEMFDPRNTFQMAMGEAGVPTGAAPTGAEAPVTGAPAAQAPAARGGLIPRLEDYLPGFEKIGPGSQTYGRDFEDTLALFQ